jgi:hypothetical protein
MSWQARWRAPLLLFALGLVVFGATAGNRLRRQSSDPHFVYQATAWLDGELVIDPPPERPDGSIVGDDWAKVETVELDDGSVVRGRRLNTRRTFAVAGGDEIPVTRIRRSVATQYYVSFPPFPAVLLVPQAAIHGRIANDVVPTVIIAALALPLAFASLRRARDAGLSHRTPTEEVWLVVALAFGTVLYFSAVQGRVWFTAHVVAVALTFGYVWCSIEARHPVLAGLCLGLGAVTRTPLAFMFPLFALEAWRVSGGRAGLRRALLLGARFAAPVVVIAIAAMIYNAARFGDPLEFGHSYLAVKQQSQIETLGLFSPRYLGRNLAVAFTLLPDLSGDPPYVSISGHGLALWFTTPVLLLVLWPRERSAFHRALWVTVGAVAIPSLLYQNSGWVQFGYRFSLDYMPFLLLLLAVGARPLGRRAKALICIGIAINLFGAVTFARDGTRWPWCGSVKECKHYRTDNATYQTVVKH